MAVICAARLPQERVAGLVLTAACLNYGSRSVPGFKDANDEGVKMGVGFCKFPMSLAPSVPCVLGLMPKMMPSAKTVKDEWLLLDDDKFRQKVAKVMRFSPALDIDFAVEKRAFLAKFYEGTLEAFRGNGAAGMQFDLKCFKLRTET